MEVKSVTLGWYEKCDISENELLYAEELLAVDNDLKECDNILSEVGLQTGYGGYEKQIYEIAEKRQHLWDFIQALSGYLDIYLSEPLRQKLNHGACETISRIHMADFQVENTLGVQVQVDTRGYADITFSKDKLTLRDFLGNAIGENAKTCIPNLSGTTCECVEEFAVIFQQQYDDMVAQGEPGEYPPNLESYLDQIVSLGEYGHKEDHPLCEILWSNFLDLFIIKPLIESCCGYNLVTKEDLTEMERSMNVVGAIVDTVTLVTGIYGFTTVAKEMGWKKAAAYFGKLALVELSADVSATAVASLGEYYEWPVGVTLLLSLGTGLTVGQVGNHLIFKRNGIEILRKEIPEGEEFLNSNPFLNQIEYGNVRTLGDRAIEGDTGFIWGDGYRVSNEIIEQGRRITHFDCPDDPIREILGRGMDSNPEEWNRIIKELQDSGVEIIYREGVLGYAPHPSVNGIPGQFLIDPNASISALEHEYLHFIQAENAGFPSMRGAFEDSTARIANETACYTIEIQRAQELGLDNVVEQLQKNLQKEIDTISASLDWPY